MFTSQTERDLYADMTSGKTLDVIRLIPARYHEEELAEILWIWSEYRNDPVAMVSKMNNQIARLIVEAANNADELNIEQQERDCCRDADDAYQEMRRDRMAEEGF